MVSGVLFAGTQIAHAEGEKNLRVVKLEDGRTFQLRYTNCGTKATYDIDGVPTGNSGEEECKDQKHTIVFGKEVELEIGYQKDKSTPCKYVVKFEQDRAGPKMDVIKRISGDSFNGYGCPNEGPGDQVFDAIPEADDKVAADGSVDGEDKEEKASNCEINGIGWMLCPVFYFLGALVDGAQAGVVKLLDSQPLNIDTSGNNPTYEAWKSMRNIGNVAFVIAFLLIIFSQLTNVGISNYGVKKLLPRLVIAAILVNISYWICAIAVDITNILGYSIKDQMQSLADGMGSPEDNGVFGGAVSGDGMFMTIVGGALTATLVGANLQFMLLSVLIPLLITAAAAIVTVVVVLTIRQALIIVLIVVSPLAFVAFLLPNTENLFNKWKGLFTTLLIMFPVVSLIFGVSAFASKVIMYGTEDATIQVVGAFVAIIPLFITPVVMKGAGGLLNRVAGVVNNTDKGIFDRARNMNNSAKNAAAAQRRGDNLKTAGNILKADGRVLGEAGSRRRRAYAALRSRGASVQADTAKKQAFMEGAAKEQEEEYIAGRAISEGDTLGENGKIIKAGYATRIAGQDKAEGFRASAQSAVNKIEQQDIQSRVILMEQETDPRLLVSKAASDFETAMAQNDLIGAMASQTILLSSGSKGLSKLQDAYENIQKDPSSEASKNFESTDQGSVGGALRSSLNKAGLKGKNNALARLAHSGGDIADLKVDPATYNLSASELVAQSEQNLRAAKDNGAITVEQAVRTLGNANAMAGLSDDKVKILEDVAGAAAPRRTSASGNASTNTAPSGNTTPNQGTTGGGSSQSNSNTPQSRPVAQPQQSAAQPQAQPQQPASQPQANPQPQAKPTVVNVPGSGNWQQTQSGMFVPQGYANASQQASSAQAQSQPQQAPVSSPPQSQSQNFATTNANTSNQQTNNTTVNQTIRNEYDTKISQAGGIQQMSQQDLVGLINKTQNISGMQGEHDNLRKEFGRRRGSNIPSHPYDPKNPPSAPPPPPTY